MSEYLISNYGVLYNRRFYPCSSPEELSKHWEYAHDRNFMVTAFIFNSVSGCYDKLTNSMVINIIGG